MGEEEPRTIISGLVQFVPLEEMQASMFAAAVAGITTVCVPMHTCCKRCAAAVAGITTVCVPMHTCCKRCAHDQHLVHDRPI